VRNYYQNRNEKPHPIDYTNWEDSIAIFGCSCAYGHYLDPKDHLHNVIETDRPINNFAYPGESNWHMWMKAIDHIKEYGMPHRICIGWTSPYRIAFYNEGIPEKKEIMPIGHWTAKAGPTFRIGKEWVLNMKITQEEYSKLIVDSMKLICGEHLIHWTLFHNLKDVKEGPGKNSWSQAVFYEDGDDRYGGLDRGGTGIKRVGSSPLTSGIEPLGYFDKASDGSHPGPLTIKNIAKLIESKL
tara:strand:- start:709 stop:1431 length:723 start_codon:yes stop_codon:yes gene_type:complete